MKTYRVGYLVGSLSSTSINRTLSKALVMLAPPDLELVEIPIGDLPLYSPDYDADYPPEARELKERWPRSTPCCSSPPSTTGASRARSRTRSTGPAGPGANSFARKPAAMIGASPAKIGTAVAQQNLKSVLSFCNAPQMSAPEAYIRFDPRSLHRDRRDHRPHDGPVLDRLHERLSSLHLPGDGGARGQARSKPP